jgi:hypothetical protein
MTLVLPRLVSGASGEHLAYTVAASTATTRPTRRSSTLRLVTVRPRCRVSAAHEDGRDENGPDSWRKAASWALSRKTVLPFLDEEVEAIYKFLTTEWTAQRGLEEEKKIPILFKKQIDKGQLPPP